MTTATRSEKVIDLSKARLNYPMKMPNGKPVPPWMTYTEPKLYQLRPCEIIELPTGSRAGAGGRA